MNFFSSPIDSIETPLIAELRAPAEMAPTDEFGYFWKDIQVARRETTLIERYNDKRYAEEDKRTATITKEQEKGSTDIAK